MSDAVLTVDNLRAGYGDEDILKGVSLEMKRGSIVAIIGPNGSGKSTLLKAIYGLVPTRRGTVILHEGGKAIRLTGRRPAAITALGLNMVPQLANVFPEMTVLENLEIGASPIRHRLSEQLEKIQSVLPLIGPLLPKRAATLSGGQRQMVALSRALMSEPRLLILDEPSAGLAPKVQDEVFARIKTINGLGVSILMVEQRARQCLAISDYGYVLEQGHNRLEGPAESLLENPEVVRLYLGGTRVASREWRVANADDG
ncbi:branched-chain amino acid transport system ATP-binding protein/neutral amino acid transport system ATP-binding protein [Rhizobiales bacterium GAS113]|nr:branched-chain amino acid transport system ATP-binding protein/neutral amino acid transport system ATP-binding protein [Rhizobiales bacterium GAS113]